MNPFSSTKHNIDLKNKITNLLIDHVIIGFGLGGEFYDQITRDVVKGLVKKLVYQLWVDAGYDGNSNTFEIICGVSNNPPELIDHNKIGISIIHKETENRLDMVIP